MGYDEQRELGTMAKQAMLLQFLLLWTSKEALVKALGTSFSTNISSFQARPNSRRGELGDVFRFFHFPFLPGAWKKLPEIGLRPPWPANFRQQARSSQTQVGETWKSLPKRCKDW